MKSDRGFSLIELIVATGLTAAVTVLACGIAIDAQALWRAEGGRLELRARARATSDLVRRALVDAGAGARGGEARGPLVRLAPPIVPRRTGRRGADPPDRVRTDAFTLMRSLPDVEEMRLAVPASSGAPAFEIDPCVTADCGVPEGSVLLIADGQGNYELASLQTIAGTTVTVQSHGPPTGIVYPAGSPVLAVSTDVFYLDGSTRTLRRFDGDASDVPVADDVVGVSVEYEGDVMPPGRPKPPPGEENCFYAADGTYRLALFPLLGVPGDLFVPLTPDRLADGPWCGLGATVFDGDLLRIRRIRVRLRFQAADPALRGVDPARFAVAGTGRDPSVLVPDLTTVIDVAPRNLRVLW